LSTVTDTPHQVHRPGVRGDVQGRRATLDLGHRSRDGRLTGAASAAPVRRLHAGIRSRRRR
jgi:hypothetical protein